jgi:hypothetical protein
VRAALADGPRWDEEATNPGAPPLEQIAARQRRHSAKIEAHSLKIESLVTAAARMDGKLDVLVDSAAAATAEREARRAREAAAEHAAAEREHTARLAKLDADRAAGIAKIERLPSTIRAVGYVAAAIITATLGALLGAHL